MMSERQAARALLTRFALDCAGNGLYFLGAAASFLAAISALGGEDAERIAAEVLDDLSRRLLEGLEGQA